MDEVLDKLVDDRAQLIKLFTPAFDHGPTEPGYIEGYPPGVRENGDQYTHAATWVVCALAQLGRGDDAYRCLQILNPVNHALTQAAAAGPGIPAPVVGFTELQWSMYWGYAERVTL